VTRRLSLGVSGWGRTGQDYDDWRRERSWLGRHTLLAALLGVAVPVLLGALAGVYENVPNTLETPANLRALAPDAWDAAYTAALPAARVDWNENGCGEVRDIASAAAQPPLPQYGAAHGPTSGECDRSDRRRSRGLPRLRAVGRLARARRGAD